MACGGDVTVLFTPARLSDRVWDALAAEVLRCVRDRVPGWLVLPLDGAAPHIDETPTAKIVSAKEAEANVAPAVVEAVAADIKIPEIGAIISFPILT